MNYKKLIIDSGKSMLNEGLTIETWGNISAMDPETRLVYITPSGMDYFECCEDDIVVIDIDGKIIEGQRKPSIETGLHLSVYRNREDANAVVHTHPLYSTVFSCVNEAIPLLVDEAAQTLGAPVKTGAYALPGTTELAEECVKALGNQANACLLKSHGAVCIGSDMKSAFKAAKVLEVTAQIYYMICSIHKDYTEISDSDIQAMKNFAKNEYGQKNL